MLEHEQAAARCQHAPDIGEKGFVLFGWNMVKHAGREDDILAVVLQRERAAIK